MEKVDQKRQIAEIYGLLDANPKIVQRVADYCKTLIDKAHFEQIKKNIIINQPELTTLLHLIRNHSVVSNSSVFSQSYAVSFDIGTMPIRLFIEHEANRGGTAEISVDDMSLDDDFCMDQPFLEVEDYESLDHVDQFNQICQKHLPNHKPEDILNVILAVLEPDMEDP